MKANVKSRKRVLRASVTKKETDTPRTRGCSFCAHWAREDGLTRTCDVAWCYWNQSISPAVWDATTAWTWVLENFSSFYQSLHSSYHRSRAVCDGQSSNFAESVQYTIFWPQAIVFFNTTRYERYVESWNTSVCEKQTLVEQNRQYWERNSFFHVRLSE